MMMIHLILNGFLFNLLNVIRIYTLMKNVSLATVSLITIYIEVSFIYQTFTYTHVVLYLVK